jgi:hypothetical protein
MLLFECADATAVTGSENDGMSTQCKFRTGTSFPCVNKGDRIGHRVQTTAPRCLKFQETLELVSVLFGRLLSV